MDLEALKAYGTTVESLATAIEDLDPAVAEKALTSVLAAVQQQLATPRVVNAEVVAPPTEPRARRQRAPRRISAGTPEKGAVAELDAEIRASAKSGAAMETRVRNILTTVQAFGEAGATTRQLMEHWGQGITVAGALYRLQPARSKKLIAKAGPPKGAGPWRLTGRAIEWLEKHPAPKPTAK